MHIKSKFTGVVLAISGLLASAGACPADAQWEQKPLPGMTSGTEIGITAAAGGALIGALFVVRHFQKSARSKDSIHVPLSVGFANSTGEITVENSSAVPINISELNLSKGFNLDGSSRLPILLEAGSTISLSVHHVSGARGVAEMVVLEGSKTKRYRVALRDFSPARTPASGLR